MTTHATIGERQLRVPRELEDVLARVPEVILPRDRAELIDLALGGPDATTLEVTFDVPGVGPVREAAVRLTLGDAFMSLGHYELAQPHLERSLALRQEHLVNEIIQNPGAIIVRSIRIRGWLGGVITSQFRLVLGQRNLLAIHTGSQRFRCRRGWERGWRGGFGRGKCAGCTGKRCGSRRTFDPPASHP